MITSDLPTQLVHEFDDLNHVRLSVLIITRCIHVQCVWEFCDYNDILIGGGILLVSEGKGPLPSFESLQDIIQHVLIPEPQLNSQV